MTHISSSGLRELKGVLKSGTEYRIGVPENWDGTLINDLDAAISLYYMSDRAELFLNSGYAYSGTNRRPDRALRFDPRSERNEQVEVLDLFDREFGQPEFAIQFGCSGGGGIALSMAESCPDRINGAVSANGAEPIVMSNQRLDLLFALKALLAANSELPVVDITQGTREKAAEEWRRILLGAQESAAGRAKICLAATIAQVPPWGGAFAPYPERPKANDFDAIQQAILRSTTDATLYAVQIRHLYDNPAGVMSWNLGIDYQKFYEAAGEDQKNLVVALYAKASSDAERAILEDLERVNAGPRIEASVGARSYWRSRALTGTPQVPILQVSTLGDSTRSAAMMAAYEEGVERGGLSHLYRQALIDAPGHCTMAVSEMAGLVDAILHRIKAGNWGNRAGVEELNHVSRGFELGEPRFIDTSTLPKRSNRVFFPNEVQGPQLRADFP